VGSVTVQINIFVAGVTFDDLTTERWITAADLKAIGEYRFRMLHPDSVGALACKCEQWRGKGRWKGKSTYSALRPVP